MTSTSRTLGFLLLFASCSRAPAPTASAERPNLIVISIDTLNRSALRCFEPRAAPLPFLDAFAAESVRFVHAITPASWTLPAHASLFTGVYPNGHGATDPRVQMSKNVATLAGQLASEYDTAAFARSVYLDPGYGLDRGFAKYDYVPEPEDKPAAASSGSDPVFAAASEFVSTRSPGGRPLSLFLQAFSVHNYYQQTVLPDDVTGDDAVLRRNIDWLTGEKPCPPEAWAALARKYAERVDQMSRDFEAFATALKRAHLWDTSVIVFLSDHGEGFEPELGRIHHGGQLHADVISIPLLVHLPGTPGRDESTPASLIDVMPTLLVLAHVKPPPGLDGVSLVPILREGHPSVAPRTLYAMEHAYWWQNGRRGLVENVAASPLAAVAVRGDLWGIRGSGRSKPTDLNLAEGELLYDLLRDPDQRSPLSDPQALAAFDKSIGASPDGRVSARQRPNAPAIEEQLKRLGYTR